VYGSGSAGSPFVSEMSETAGTAPSPASLYAAHCASCHGRDGRAQTAKGRKTDATDFTDDWNKDEARGIRIIANGKGDMPGFKRKLNQEQIKSLMSYVRRF
jgi:cytochrome c6